MSSVLSDGSGVAAQVAAVTSDAEDAWAGLAAAADSTELCRHWLTLQCIQVPGARAGLLLLRNTAGDAYVPAGVWPDPQRDLAYLAAPAQQALARRTGVVQPAGGETGVAATVHIAYPVESDGELFGVVALDLSVRPEAELRAALRQLVWGGAWLDGLCLRRNATAMRLSSQRSVLALDVLAAVQEQGDLQHAALVLVNELVTRLAVDRASLGLMRGAQLELQAISRSAWFERKSQLVVALGNAMDEALDQRATVCEPPLPDSSGSITVAQRDLATRTGNTSICAVPLLISGKPVGAILFERAAVPYTAEEVATFEALATLAAPALDARLALDRWVTGRLFDRLVEWRDKLFGARHPTLKMGVAFALLLALFLVFAEGDFRVSAKTVVEGAVQRAAVAPFEGFIAEAPVRAGDTVRAGQLLVRLEDRDLRLERVKLVAERDQQLRKYHDALAKHDRPAAGILMAQAGQSAAQIALVDEKLARTRVTAPSDGVVVSGDLSQLLGSPVEQGKLLFEIAPLDAYRIILKVDDRDIAFVVNGQHGRLVLSGLGGDPLQFQVSKVTSVSTPLEGHNYFRVEAQLEAPRIGVRPGMEGVGKIIVDHRKLAWIWTRSLIDWMRITFWTWMP
jgi:biotin carboxyl carrier protein